MNLSLEDRFLVIFYLIRFVLLRELKVFQNCFMICHCVFTLYAYNGTQQWRSPYITYVISCKHIQVISILFLQGYAYNRNTVYIIAACFEGGRE